MSSPVRAEDARDECIDVLDELAKVSEYEHLLGALRSILAEVVEYEDGTSDLAITYRHQRIVQFRMRSPGRRVG